MPEPREARSIIENAEQAAATGNYGAAEHLLREAAALQEQTLGANHPDLANTLNNLGVVCELTDNPIDAEHYFCRAYTIATAALPPDHPFVATSRQNLHDFCAARGRPMALPPSPPSVAAWLETRAPAVPLRESSSQSANTKGVTPIPRKRFVQPIALAALGGVALLLAIFTLGRPWDSPVEETTAPPTTIAAPGRQTPTAQPATQPAEPRARPHQAAKRTSGSRGTDAAIGATPGTAGGPAVMPTVATARLCTALRDWRCQAAESQVPPGPLTFYTQVKSATATTIEHRWYQGDRLHRAVPLRIEANPGSGYRTYSRNTISSERAGDWRVELRSADGTVLHEERFIVR